MQMISSLWQLAMKLVEWRASLLNVNAGKIKLMMSGGTGVLELVHDAMAMSSLQQGCSC